MTIHIPEWLLWLLAIPAGIVSLVLLFLGGMAFWVIMRW